MEWMNVRGSRSVNNLAWMILRGFAIGTADLAPGVSGGTVALVTGIYSRLVTAVGTCVRTVEYLMRTDLRRASRCFSNIDWTFLIAIAAGAGLAITTLAGMIENLLENHPVRTAAVFFGLISGAILVAWRLLKEPANIHFAISATVGVAAFILFGLGGASVPDPHWYLFMGAGAVAICAFILPGVSGSFLLLTVGMYQHVIGALNDRDTTMLLAFALGAATGLALFSRLLERLLASYHDLVVSTMIGLMIGSFRILWPWPAGLGDANGVGATTLGRPGPDLWIPVVLAIMSAIPVVGFSTWTRRKQTQAVNSSTLSNDDSSSP